MHGAHLTIDLDAVAANWRLLRQRHGAPVAGVVKADGYGLGAVAIARRLAVEGCDQFFVAHLAEAIALRESVPGIRIAVLNGLLPGTGAEYLAYDLHPVLGSLPEIALWSAQARAAGHWLPALLHVDTGINRLGLTAADLLVLRDEPARLEGVALRYLLTHLISAELPDDPLNALQALRFTEICASFPGIPTSLANSSGIFLGAPMRSDLARPGAALYGINPTPSLPNPMRDVLRLDAKVLQIREIATGAAVGYNATWRAVRPSRIATVSVGYADGWLRSQSGQGVAYFDGRPLPLVGRVSMDLVTYDATDMPALAAGDTLELIGPHCPPDAVARAAGTNGYEILTSLGRRYQRTYRAA